jgi:hypothetical protein
MRCEFKSIPGLRSFDKRLTRFLSPTKPSSHKPPSSSKAGVAPSSQSDSEISRLLSRLKLSEHPYHLLLALDKALRLSTPSSLDRHCASLSESFANPLCFSGENISLTFSIMNTLFNAGSECFSGFADQVLPFLSHPSYSHFAATIIAKTLRRFPDLANGLIYESDLFEVLRACLDDAWTVALVLRWTLKSCNATLLQRFVAKAIFLFRSIFFSVDPEVIELSAKAMILFIRKASVDVEELFPPEFFEFVLHLPAEIECLPILLSLLNQILICRRDFFERVIVRFQLFEWLVGCLYQERGERGAMRILGNLSLFPCYCEYFVSHGLYDVVLRRLDGLAFASLDDFFIFFCRIVCYRPRILAESDDVFEKLGATIESLHAPAFWGPFLEMWQRITREDACFRWTDEVSVALAGVVSSAEFEDGIRQRAGAILVEYDRTQGDAQPVPPAIPEVHGPATVGDWRSRFDATTRTSSGHELGPVCRTAPSRC